jgi:hypothetical protein
MYLIYASEEAALERADEEGKTNNFSYWTEGTGTRWLSKPVPTADDMWALGVSGYKLNRIELTSVVDSYLIPDTIEDNT